ncbi:MAG: ABC transporter substrate-binding protein [Dehalococcoidia bacterium]|nr:ABC transporter substrate-binding protein [Dehalococcoidia bacterium]
MARDYYKILQVDSEADPEVIKSAYKRLAQKYHPDIDKSANAEARMKEINEAYEVLGDPQKRAEYDRVKGVFGKPRGSSSYGGEYSSKNTTQNETSYPPPQKPKDTRVQPSKKPSISRGATSGWHGRQLILALVSVVILVAIVAAVWSNVSKSNPSNGPSDAATPQLTEVDQAGFYRNATYGFSLSYPTDWEKQDSPQGGALLLVLSPDRTGMVQVWVQYLSAKMTPQEFAAENIKGLEQGLSDFALLSEGEVKVDAESGYEQVFTGAESGLPLKVKVISMVRGSRAFAALALSPESDFASQADTFDEILYSLRLEEPSLSGVPRNESLILTDIGPTTMDPALSRDSTSASYVMELFSGLVTLDKGLKVVPEIAQKWEVSDDGKTYTFHLRQDVKFQDGKKVTADDFKYSLERACNPATGSKTAANYLGDIVGVNDRLAGTAREISGVKVMDKYTLRITIDAPKAYFLAKLTHPVAFVVDQANVESGGEWWREPNGTGPFKLKEWKVDEIITLERNDGYYGEMPKVKNVVFRLYAGIPMMMYETGEIDINYVSTQDIERVLDPANALNKELITIPEFSLWYIGFNVTKPPFDDPRVRQAFCYAVDKDKIIKLVIKDMAKRADGILPPGMPGYSEGLKGLEFDPAKAKELIGESTYGSVSNLPPITFTTAGLGDISPINQALIDMWKQNLGVDVAVRQIDPDDYFDVLKEDKDELFDSGWIADYPDPQNFLDMLFYSQSEDNAGEYSNPEVDVLLQTARGEMDTDARLKMYQDIERMIVEDAACLPMFFNVNYILVKPYVKDFVAAPMPIAWLKYIIVESHD